MDWLRSQKKRRLLAAQNEGQKIAPENAVGGLPLYEQLQARLDLSIVFWLRSSKGQSLGHEGLAGEGTKLGFIIDADRPNPVVFAQELLVHAEVQNRFTSGNDFTFYELPR